MKFKNTTIIYTLMILVTSILFSGCGNKNKDIENAINKHVNALEKEDINSYMATIDKSSSDYDQTKKTIEELFKMYDLKYEIKKIQVISVDGVNAKVRVDQITKKINGDEFTDNETVAVHTLKKVEQNWKFVSTNIEKRTKLK